MSDHHTYKKIEIVGSSRNSVDEAIRNAIAEANKTLQNLEWFEVGEIRGHIADGQVAHFQVAVIDKDPSGLLIFHHLHPRQLVQRGDQIRITDAFLRQEGMLRVGK